MVSLLKTAPVFRILTKWWEWPATPVSSLFYYGITKFVNRAVPIAKLTNDEFVRVEDVVLGNPALDLSFKA